MLQGAAMVPFPPHLPVTSRQPRAALSTLLKIPL